MQLKSKVWIPLLSFVVAAALVLAGCKATRGGYESAPHQVVRTSGNFQVRDYSALTVVETPMASSGNGADGSFNRLFRFITGGNEAKQRIVMTTPVFMTGDESNATMAFVLPAKMKTAQVPKPSDGAVAVRELEAGRAARLTAVLCDPRHRYVPHQQPDSAGEDASDSGLRCGRASRQPGDHSAFQGLWRIRPCAQPAAFVSASRFSLGRRSQAR